MDDMGTKIRRQRRRLGLTLDELAVRTAISKPYLSLIETGRVANPPSDEKLRRLEETLGFPAGQLVTEAHLHRTPQDVRAALQSLVRRQKQQGAADLDDAYVSGMLHELLGEQQQNIQPVATNLLPVINCVSAGYPMDFTDLSYPRGVADDYVSCPDVKDRDAFGARVFGDSMTPKYLAGEIVIFSPNAAVKSGDDCFVRFADGHTTFKRVFFETDEQGNAILRLQPRNQQYRPQIVPADHITGLWKAVFKYQRVDED